MGRSLIETWQTQQVSSRNDDHVFLWNGVVHGSEDIPATGDDDLAPAFGAAIVAEVGGRASEAA